MRDEFNAATKDLLARRVGFRCSNPACRQPTCGPQANPAGAINIGVAAHISGASANGPRYDPSLTSEQRSSADNGIWLCQNHAKLIDSDVTQFTVALLRDWKSQAEAVAARELKQRLSRCPDATAVLERMERLMPALLAEMRRDLAESPLRREFVLLKRGWTYWAKRNVLVYYYDDHPDLDDEIQILENASLVQDIAFNNVRRFVISELLADYLGAP
jgi:hypothetical protein